MKGFRDIQLFKALAWWCSHSDRGTGKDFYCLKTAGEFSEPGCHCHPLYISFQGPESPIAGLDLRFQEKNSSLVVAPVDSINNNMFQLGNGFINLRTAWA